MEVIEAWLVSAETPLGSQARLRGIQFLEPSLQGTVKSSEVIVSQPKRHDSVNLFYMKLPLGGFFPPNVLWHFDFSFLGQKIMCSISE